MATYFDGPFQLCECYDVTDFGHIRCFPIRHFTSKLG
jgi:hypothetical protein